MSRSRAFNRSSRFNAKKRRKSLRSVLPGLQNDSLKGQEPIDHSQELIQKLTHREALSELIDPSPIT